MCTKLHVMKNKEGFLKQVPCKYLCLECRNMRREDFAQRLKFEYKSYDYIGAFISLTYSDKNLPILLPEGSAVVGEFFGSVPPAYGSTLYRPDLSNFCDKLQKRLKRKFGRSGKYIGFGDYGDDTHRPHYHLIYLGCPQDRKLIYDTWQYGNIDVGNIDHGSIRYVLDYINKDPIFSDSKYKLYGDFEPPFYHFSKGLGFEEIYRLHELGHFDKYGQIQFSKGHNYTLPPYLKEKLGYETKPQYYGDSVYDWQQVNQINNIELAQSNRNVVVERCLMQSAIARGGTKLDLNKMSIQESQDRQNRFNGFTDYEKLDSYIFS